jgi:hypothetical protein
VNQKLGKKKKVKIKGTASSPTELPIPTSASVQPQAKTPKSKPKRSRLVLFAEIAGGIIAVAAGVATIVAGTGYAIEKWQETVARIEFSGDVDQKKPLTLPLSAKNPSDIFAMYEPRMECSINVEYTDETPAHHVFIFADQLPVTTPTISPGGTGTYFCDAPQMVTITDTPTGAVIPMKQAEMIVTLHYKTKAPFLIEHTVVNQFAVFVTSSGYRWVKGTWLGGHPTVQRPPNLEKFPPTFSRPVKP